VNINLSTIVYVLAAIYFLLYSLIALGADVSIF
jgi:hypothetical protein